jgi:hypothetical protein
MKHFVYLYIEMFGIYDCEDSYYRIPGYDTE